VSEPVFKLRPKKESYQVRFWSTHPLYRTFFDTCKRQDLKVQDVFNDFMLWFIKTEEKNALKMITRRRREKLPP
jgi:hypothetical protein